MRTFALLFAASVVAITSAEEAEVTSEAFAVDDACAAQGSEECELSLRQLRAAASKKGESVPPEKSAAVAKHDHAKAEAARAAPAARPVVAVQANATAAGCTAEDAKKMASLGSGNADGTFPKISSDCGHQAYSWFSFHPSHMNSCLESSAGISASCAACFVKAGQYGVDNCKLQCLFGSWCSQSCLGCSEPGAAEAKTCAGVAVPTASFC